jgi:ATP-dependent Clp protease protease subunit
VSYIPSVLEKTGTTEREYGIFSRLLKDRVIYLTDEINDAVSDAITAQLLYLDYQNTEDISLYINSPGGIITSGLAILDVMNYVKSDIKTIVMGQAASMGSFLAAHGTKGKRFSLPNSRFMYHQPSGGAGGQASDIEIQAKEIMYLKEKLNIMLCNVSKLSLQEVSKLTDRDSYMTPEAAEEAGFIDTIINERQ